MQFHIFNESTFTVLSSDAVHRNCPSSAKFTLLTVAVCALKTVLSPFLNNCKHFIQQELHSSRMHTARLFTISPSMHCAGVCLARGVSSLGGVCLARGGCLLCQGGGIPACTEADPPVNRITDACENITLPQLRCGR